MTARLSFEAGLELLHKDFNQMAYLTEQAMDKMICSYQEKNYTIAREIIEGDRIINDMEKALESRCLSLIVKQQPVARDLRVVSSVLKVVTDMERIGDHAADIAELILRMEGDDIYVLVEEIPQMAQAARGMVHDSVKAFLQCDLKTAKEVEKADDIVDNLFQKLKEEMVRRLQLPNAQVDNYVDTLMIAKYLERIGDHAVNICEWTEFHETGTLNQVRIF